MKNFTVQFHIPNSQKQNASAGFTIIETLVSLAIFTISILGLIVITSQGAANTNFAKNKLVASYLGQEGIEMVRNLRDSSALSGATWQDTFSTTSLSGLSNCYVTGQQTGCDIDAYTLDITPCSTTSRNACGVLKYDIANGDYRSNAAGGALPDSAFTRITSLRDVSPNEVEITSTVYWNQGATQKSISVNETLFDWVTIAPVAPPITGQ